MSLSRPLLGFAVAAIASAQSLSHRLDEVFAPWKKPDHPGAEFVLVRQGKIRYRFSSGPLNAKFDPGSLAPQFQAMARLIRPEQPDPQAAIFTPLAMRNTTVEGVTTVEDLMRWDRALSGEKLLKKPQIDALLSQPPWIAGVFESQPVQEQSNTRMWIWRCPALNETLILLSNADLTTELRQKILQAIHPPPSTRSPE